MRTVYQTSSIDSKIQRNRWFKLNKKLDKACFAFDATCSDSKNLKKRTISDKISKGTTYEIAINLKYDGYQRGLVSMVYTVFLRKHDQEKL